MRTLLHVAQLAGLNAVPVLGVLGGAWSSATALALYWCETVLLSMLIAVRIELHRHATHKRGHLCGDARDHAQRQPGHAAPAGRSL
jgi:hypothetical protein